MRTLISSVCAWISHRAEFCEDLFWPGPRPTRLIAVRVLTPSAGSGEGETGDRNQSCFSRDVGRVEWGNHGSSWLPQILLHTVTGCRGSVLPALIGQFRTSPSLKIPGSTSVDLICTNASLHKERTCSAVFDCNKPVALLAHLGSSIVGKLPLLQTIGRILLAILSASSMSRILLWQ